MDDDPEAQYRAGINKGFTTASAGGRLDDAPPGCTGAFLKGWVEGFADYGAIKLALTQAPRATS